MDYVYYSIETEYDENEIIDSRGIFVHSCNDNLIMNDDYFYGHSACASWQDRAVSFWLGAEAEKMADCYFDMVDAKIIDYDEPCPFCGDLGTGYGSDGVSRCPYGFVKKEDDE